MWDDVRELFPVHRNCVYLNNAGVSPPSLRVLEALQTYHSCHAQHGAMVLRDRYGSTARRIKGLLSTLLQCDAGRLALTHNTSEGMSILAQGLDWEPGDKVLGLGSEYPANVYPWRNLEHRGVVYEQVGTTGDGNDLARLEQNVTDQVRLVTVSAVNWCTGTVPDLERLGRACAESGAMLVVDTAQALGVVRVEPDRIGASAMAGSAWKWLMGPMGVGIFYCTPSVLNRVNLVFVEPTL